MTRRRQLGELFVIMVQLALAALVVRRFQLENVTFYRILLLVIAGFPVNALLPARFRLGFFALLSMAAIGLVFGPRDGMLLVATGLALIGICHLPVRFATRIAVLATAGVLLALARAGVVPSPLAQGVWPILGSMFMFRLAVYVHALRHDPTPPTLARSVSYFFMLPNVCYALFPVVDYGTFTRTYYDAEPARIYQRGMKWIARGLVHLLLYRAVYLYFTVEVSDVRTLADLVQSLLAVFFLYLRVSGQFHLIVGLLHLFGFHLPETHRLYFLASSISDYWRRINIYWKDFMMKLVFYPGFFRWRASGERRALVSATMLVFFATWLLHSYQWFWLRAAFPVTPQDILFWALLGALVVHNTLRESPRRRAAAATRQRWSRSLAIRTMATFVSLCVLWSLWSADSVVDWLFLWPAALHVGARDVLIVGTLFATGLAVMGVSWDAPVAPRTAPLRLHERDDVRTLALLCTLVLVSIPSIHRVAGTRVAGMVQSLRSPTLSRFDRTLQQQGYYEKLDNRGRLSMQLWNVIGSRPRSVPLIRTAAYRPRPGDFLGYDLRPLSSGTIGGALLTVNRWGMRDRDYTETKPAGVRRIALVGPSFTMGSGLTDDETFDTQLERRLDTVGTPGHYEVLNFGVAAYSLTHFVRILDDRVYRFEPDVVVVSDGRYPNTPTVNHLLGALRDGTVKMYPDLQALLEKNGLRDVAAPGPAVPTAPLRELARMGGASARMPEREARIRLQRMMPEIMEWSFQHMGEVARREGAVPVFIDGMFPMDTLVSDTPMLRAAQKAGFVVIQLAGIWEGKPRTELRMSSWDEHPNATAMKMIAAAIEDEFRRRESELHLGIGSPPTRPQ